MKKRSMDFNSFSMQTHWYCCWLQTATKNILKNHYLLSFCAPSIEEYAVTGRGLKYLLQLHDLH